jgi:hypothetical protein
VGPQALEREISAIFLDDAVPNRATDLFIGDTGISDHFIKQQNFP